MANTQNSQRPDPHACSPAAAAELTRHKFGAVWTWKISGSRYMCGFCPWCGEKLPNMKAARPALELVR